MGSVPWTRRLLAPLCALAALGGTAAGQAAGQAIEDRWSGRWEVTFTTEGDGRERVSGPHCCVVVTPLAEERGRALVNGTTGDPADGVFVDVVCAVPAPRRFYEAASAFEWVSGHQGVVPGPGVPTDGASAVFCTDDSPDAVRGHYRNALGAFDPLIGKPVAHGSALATRTAPQRFEGSLTHFPGDFPGPAFGTAWVGRCIEGPCRAELRRPHLRVTRISAYNALLGFLRGARGARLELTRPDGTVRALRRETIDLEAGDVVTSHGMYAEVEITRVDATVVTVTLEPGGSIAGLADPGVIRHRSGTIVAGSAAGFTADSTAFSDAREHAGPAGGIPTRVAPGGRVSLSLDPARRALTVRGLAGRATVGDGPGAVTLRRGQEARTTAAGVRRLAPPPDLSRVIGPAAALAAGPARLVAPRRITTRSLSRARCLLTRVSATADARVAVTLIVGTVRRGNVVTQRRRLVPAGARRDLCLPLPPRARGIPAGTPLTIALGVRSGALRRLASRPVPLSPG